MLCNLSIKNFTTVEHLDIDFEDGLTVITGETGAGKSVLLDALGMALGDRSNTTILRDEEKNAEIHALFNLKNKENLINWLESQSLVNHDNINELIIRRVINPAGRSKAYINGSSVSINELKMITEKLVDLHNQHEHQSLLNKRNHCDLLDNFGECIDQKIKVATLAKKWQSLSDQINELSKDNSEKEAQIKLLEYQLQELDNLNLEQGEYEKLILEHKQLSSSEEIINSLDDTINHCNNENEDSIIYKLNKSIKNLESTSESLPDLKNTLDIIKNAHIQIEESYAELIQQRNQIEINPEKLSTVESRLDLIYTISRKHKTPTADLHQKHKILSEKMRIFLGSDDLLNELKNEANEIHKSYIIAAEKLTKKRNIAIKAFKKSVNNKLKDLKMSQCIFEILMDKKEENIPSINGQENIEFLISTIPKKPPQPISQIASGGELSRISLAIAVVIAQTSKIPTLVFDEVDVGIGGAVAEVVGNLLRELSNAGQAICVTHQAQVAAKAKNHLLAAKTIDKESVLTNIHQLNKEDRTVELARMMGGIDITDSSIAHAAEILETA